MESSRDAEGNRRLSWSWPRFISNSIPVFANDANPELTTSELDTLFDFQTACASPKRLTPTSLYVVKISSHESVCAKVHRKLLKEGLVIMDPPGVDTKKIGKGFANQFASIPVYAQKKLVCLLFAWEEELMRWRLLEEEEAEIRVVLGEERANGGEEQVGELEKRLLEVQGLMRVKPSNRKEVRPQGAHLNDELPPYSEG
jgi:hypothetical protein